MSTLRAQLIATAKAYLDAHENLNVTELRATYSPSCIHHTSPARVQAIFPKVDNEQYLAGVADLFKMWHSFSTQHIAEPVIDETARTVVMFVRAKGVADAGVYENEYSVTLKMNEAGTLIEERHQFFDGEPLVEWVARLGKAATELQDKVRKAQEEANATKRVSGEA